MFDWKILKSQAFDIPIISVGNLTVGGTGKTPHVEYLIRLLSPSYKVAILSRGYKRKTKGFLLASSDSTVQEIGDEPYQMKRKYPEVEVAVDANRCRGIEKLIADDRSKELDVIVLDDAFQHRYVKPGINVLLIDYHRLVVYDKLLPAGRLREPYENTSRADIVIVTKCPEDLKPVEYRIIRKSLNLFPYQTLFFTAIKYGSLHAVYNSKVLDRGDLKEADILLLTGIASPEQMLSDLLPYCKSIEHLNFSDHHRFSNQDVQKINKAYKTIESEQKLIVTTEKDATRLADVEGLDEDLKNNLYVLPITVSFMLEKTNEFNKKIIDYVYKNSRNSILAAPKNDNKA